MATGFLYLNTRNELIRLDCSKIVYMEGDGNYTNIVLVNKQKVAVCMNLSNMQQFISESLRERASIFARIGKRFIVNKSGKTKCARFEKRNVQKSRKTKRSKKIAHTTL